MAIMMVLLVVMNSLTRLLFYVLDACLTASIAAVVHSIVARPGDEEEQAHETCGYGVNQLFHHFFFCFVQVSRNWQSWQS